MGQHGQFSNETTTGCLLISYVPVQAMNLDWIHGLVGQILQVNATLLLA